MLVCCIILVCSYWYLATHKYTHSLTGISVSSREEIL